MTPQDIAALTAVAALVKQIGAWPMITLFVLNTAGPWIALWWFTRITEKRHAAVVSMYSDNVVLVEKHEHLAAEGERRESALADLIRLNTQSQTALLTWLQGRTRCVDLKGTCLPAAPPAQNVGGQQ
ncbi:hypothetical protein [Geobacter sp. SVR]|uniref:hypothetical protein n=1 Tax=Geobacter sp. SVR TaxID=2495594 RepID=UPI00143F057A|nr:hypothetical protein [Geobacter sp. SVR]BCS54547.1 hypothetical protein GSVR_28550 [Geobacter sp. SVR]GCF87147.1 hypothetical protein GSbR_37470 [Geobacter sp. SVR]